MLQLQNLPNTNFTSTKGFTDEGLQDFEPPEVKCRNSCFLLVLFTFSGNLNQIQGQLRKALKKNNGTEEQRSLSAGFG